MSISIRDLHTIEEYRQVVDLERVVWGFTDMGDMITVPVFIITVKRGAILLGAFDSDGRMVGFAYSLVAMKDGRRRSGRTCSPWCPSTEAPASGAS